MFQFLVGTTIDVRERDLPGIRLVKGQYPHAVFTKDPRTK